MAIIDLGLAEFVDTMCISIRGKVEVEGGSSLSAKVAILNHIFKAQDVDNKGTVDFEQFTNALVGLNVVGLQRGVKALFSRYDRTANGCVAYGAMIKQLMDMEPDGERTTDVRCAFAQLRTALAAHGIHGVWMLADALEAADACGSGALPRAGVTRVLASVGVKLREESNGRVLAEMDRDATGSVTISALMEAVRGIMTARRRTLVNRAWRKVSGGGARATLADVVGVAKDTGASWLDADAATCHLAAAFPADVVTAAEFVAFHRDVSAMVADDKEFASFVADSWGVPTDVPLASLVLPGTVEDTLQRSLAASRLTTPAYTTGGAAGGAGATDDGRRRSAGTARPATVTAVERVSALTGRAPATADASLTFDL